VVIVVVVVLVPIRNGDKTAAADHHGRRSHPKQHAMPNLRALISLYPLFINTPTPFPSRMPTTLLQLSSKLRPICCWPCRNNDNSNNNNNNDGSSSSRCPRAMMFDNSASASAADEDREDDVVDDMSAPRGSISLVIKV